MTTVEVAFCAQAHNLQRRIRGPPIPSIERNASDLESILVRAFIERYRPRRREKANLVYIPQQCIGQPLPTLSGSNGAALPFTAFGYWGNDGREALRGKMCHGRSPTAEAVALGKLAVLMVDGPSFCPAWRKGPLSRITYDYIAPTPPPFGAFQVFQVPYPSAGAWDGTCSVPTAPPLEARSAMFARFFGVCAQPGPSRY